MHKVVFKPLQSTHTQYLESNRIGANHDTGIEFNKYKF